MSPKATCDVSVRSKITRISFLVILKIRHLKVSLIVLYCTLWMLTDIYVHSQHPVQMFFPSIVHFIIFYFLFLHFIVL